MVNNPENNSWFEGLEHQNNLKELGLLQARLTFYRERFFELAPIVYIITTPQGKILEVNQKATRIFGFESIALINKPITEFIHKEDLKIYLQARKLLIETGKKQICDLRINPKDKTGFCCQLLLSTDKNIKGISNHCLALLNITKQKQAYEHQQEWETRFQQLFDHMDNGVAVYQSIANGQDFIFVDLNKKGQAISKVTLEEIKGKKITEIFPNVKQIGLLDLLQRVWQSGKPEELPLAQYQDNNLVQWVKNYVYKLPSGLIVAIYSDMTKLKQAEENKALLESQLHHAQKMEAMGRLATGIAHDFNNMLGVILGNVDMIIQQAAPDQPPSPEFEEIRQAALNSINLAKQLTDFARKQTVAPEIINLNEVGKNSLPLLKKLLTEDINLEFVPTKNLWDIKVDPSQIEQILTNLCLNSRDSITTNGKITIFSGNVAFSEGDWAVKHGFYLGEFVWLAVTDNGCGIPKDNLPRIFEPFFTTKDIGKGSGLGLATVYGIVNQNNGFINVSSPPDGGTTFKIYLPRYESPTRKAPPVHETKKIMTDQPTILLVEDDPAVLKITTKMLEMHGYRVLGTPTPKEAISLFKKNNLKIDLLLTDIVMPEMNGLELAKKIFFLCPHLKILFMSGYTDNVIIDQQLLDHGAGFIEKPFIAQDLYAKVQNLLGKK